LSPLAPFPFSLTHPGRVVREEQKGKGSPKPVKTGLGTFPFAYVLAGMEPGVADGGCKGHSALTTVEFTASMLPHRRLDLRLWLALGWESALVPKYD
jgi:hypothetical protein